MTCEVLGVEYEFKKVDIMVGENMTPEYLKINPQHNIPAIKDGEDRFVNKKKLYIEMLKWGDVKKCPYVA